MTKRFADSLLASTGYVDGLAYDVEMALHAANVEANSVNLRVPYVERGSSVIKPTSATLELLFETISLKVRTMRYAVLPSRQLTLTTVLVAENI